MPTWSRRREETPLDVLTATAKEEKKIEAANTFSKSDLYNLLKGVEVRALSFELAVPRGVSAGCSPGLLRIGSAFVA